MIKKIKSLFFKAFISSKLQNNQIVNYSDFTLFEKELLNQIRQYTMTSPERIKSLINAVEFLVNHSILGDFVECGVWRGGSTMIMAKTLLQLNSNDRRIWLFDTFEGMPPPSDVDIDLRGVIARDRMAKEDKDTSRVWAISSLEEVRKNVYSTGYPSERIFFIKGNVEETLNMARIPDKIALLRLDTDWYSSTKKELEVLYPRVVRNGIVIIDDYGHWSGCKKAVDEYLSKNNITVYLNRIDYTGRLLIKT